MTLSEKGDSLMEHIPRTVPFVTVASSVGLHLHDVVIVWGRQLVHLEGSPSLG
jgi:hypothetical protein